MFEAQHPTQLPPEASPSTEGIMSTPSGGGGGHGEGSGGGGGGSGSGKRGGGKKKKSNKATGGGEVRKAGPTNVPISGRPAMSNSSSCNRLASMDAMLLHQSPVFLLMARWAMQRKHVELLHSCPSIGSSNTCCTQSICKIEKLPESAPWSCSAPEKVPVLSVGVSVR